MKTAIVVLLVVVIVGGAGAAFYFYTKPAPRPQNAAPTSGSGKKDAAYWVNEIAGGVSAVGANWEKIDSAFNKIF